MGIAVVMTGMLKGCGCGYGQGRDLVVWLWDAIAYYLCDSNEWLGILLHVVCMCNFVSVGYGCECG